LQVFNANGILKINDIQFIFYLVYRSSWMCCFSKW